MGLIDVWRHLYPSGRDYTFYSNRHLSYSRINYFFTPKSEGHKILDCEILPITLSDHAPLILTWDLGHSATCKRWRLIASLLNNDDTFRHVTGYTVGLCKGLPQGSHYFLRYCKKKRINHSIKHSQQQLYWHLQGKNAAPYTLSSRKKNRGTAEIC